MRDYSEDIWQEVRQELETIWLGHKAVGLEDGFMQLYTIKEEEPWRAKNRGFSFWFGPNDIDKAIETIKEYYNEGNLPNSPLLLNPIVHRQNAEFLYEPIGSGVVWGTALCLGIADLKPESQERIEHLGVKVSQFHRGENEQAGLKMLGFASEKIPPNPDGETVPGCYELYEVANVKSEAYWKFYVLSGLNYLCKNGSYQHPSFASLFENNAVPQSEEEIRKQQVDPQYVLDAAECFNAYDRHHALFERFGVDAEHLDENLKYFNMCARDFDLFDATGPMRGGAEESFEFLVDGLIPRGAVILIAAPGGTGKSSVAHKLCVQAAIDWNEDEEPTWLGSRVNKEYCHGICVYFSGEDGPAIINARGALFDPEGRAKRLMFQRTDFGEEGTTLAQFLKRLARMPDVPVVVIDPARKYLEGDETDSEVVSNFFEAIEEFAISKKAAVIVVHHLEKGADPKSARDVLELLRGSQVFIDRPRVVLGMYRDGPNTCIGLSKCNIPPNLGMMQGERVFVRDPKSLDLVWLPGEAGVRNQELSDEELEQIKAEAELKAAQGEK